MLAVHYYSEPPRGEELAELRRQFAEFLARPHVHARHHREWISRAQFESLRDDPGTTPAALLAAVEAMLAGGVRTTSSYGRTARALAERTDSFARAEAIARAGLVAIEAWAAAKTAAGMPAAAIASERASDLGEATDALGAALLAQGRLPEAAAAIETALLLAPGEPRYLARRAALLERSGDVEAARAQLLDCRALAGAGGRTPCEAELQAMYRAEHGSSRGYTKAVARWAADRRAALQAAARTEP